ncbi:MAG: hypothetical protein ACR2LC_16275 [Pyrinomonadaceae bacterium]
MKKYILRLLVAILAFSIGTATIYFFAWDKIKTINPYRTTHSSENNSPYSILEGKTVRMKPYGATFDIPESWLVPNPVPEPAKNLYLSWDELNYLYWNDGGDAEEAQVINSVLSFKNCAAHVGDRGWGNYLWNDLQARVYVTDLTPEKIAARIENQGRDEASHVFERASVISGNHGEWEKRTLDILDAPAYSDFSLDKNLDFYYRSFGNKTVVFVFLHAGGFDETINGILNSFMWSNET